MYSVAAKFLGRWRQWLFYDRDHAIARERALYSLFGSEIEIRYDIPGY